MNIILPVLVSATLIVPLASFHGTSASADVLYEKGVELTVEMDMLAENEDYLHMLISSDQEMTELARQIAASDYHRPRMVFEVSGMEEAAASFLAQNGASFPEEIEKIATDRAITSIPAIIIARDGVTSMAVSSLINTGDCFLYGGMDGSRLYLFLYDGDYGSLVLFMPNDEGIVMANANILISEELRNLQSGEDVKEFISDAVYFAPLLSVTQVQMAK